ncbi:MAG: glutaredoxin family protein [Spirochaetales bacterium]|nr:glutaredoxin family protein [Spirochaetales bacterium]
MMIQYPMLSKEIFPGSSAVEGEPRAYLYALSDCNHCKDGMALLDSLRIPYRYVYVDTLPPEIRIQLKKEIAQRFYRNLYFPILEIPGKETLFGFEEKTWKQALKYLAG